MANYRSVFDIIGPVMVGPSSSHTAGAVAIGNAARLIFQKTPKKVVVHYYESFAKTHRGHGTDFAIAGGLLGMAPDDERIPKAPEMVAKAGIKLRFVEEEGPSPINHPNTAIIDLSDGEKQITVGGCSIVGGTIEIRLIELQGCKMNLTGPLPMVLYQSNEKNNPLVSQLNELLDQEAGLQKLQKWPVANGELYEFDIEKYLAPDTLALMQEKFKGIIYLK